MRFELLSYVTLVATLVATLAGGKLLGAGFEMQYDVFNRQLNITPVTMFQLNVTGNQIAGVTIGGTVLMSSPQPLQDWMIQYELQHVRGYTAYGLGYLLKVFFEACSYDPGSAWGRYQTCPNNSRIQPSLPQFHAFSVKF